MILGLQLKDSYKWIYLLVALPVFFTTCAFELSAKEIAATPFFYNDGVSIIKNDNSLQNKNRKDKISGKYNTQNDHINRLTYWQNQYLNFSKTNDKLEQGISLFNIATIYFEILNFEEYYDYTKKALSYFSEVGDTVKMAVCFISFGNYEHINNNFVNALDQYKKALRSFNSEKQAANRLTCLGNIGGVYIDMKEFDKGFDYLIEAEKLAISLNDTHFLSRNHYNLAEIQFQKSNFEEAILSLDKAIDLAKKIKNYNYLSRSYQRKAICFAQLNKYKKAYESSLLYIETKDSLFSIEKANKIQIIEADFNQKIAENRIAILELEQNQSELKLQKAEEQSKNLLVFLILLSIITIMCIVFVVYWFKNRQSKIMTNQKNEIQRTYIDAVLKSQEEERKRLARDLHDSLGQKLTGLLFKINEAKSSQNSNELMVLRMEEIKTLADLCYKEVRVLSHQMMPRSLQESKLIDAIEDLLQLTFNNTSIQYYLNANAIDEPNDNIKLIVYRICQELINNIIKHAKSCKEVHVSIIQNTQFLIMIIEDDGEGVFENLDFLSSNNQGIGIQNIKARLDLVGGKISYDKGDNKGLRATIRLNIEQIQE